MKMTGSTNQYNRQSSTSSNSKVDITYPSEVGSTLKVDEDEITIEMFAEVHGQETFAKRKNTTSDSDSGAEDIEHQFDDMAIRNDDNDDHDQDHNRSHNPSPVQSIGTIHDDGFVDTDTHLETAIARMENDIQLAKQIPDDLKKTICVDAKEAFHAEFARLISVPLALRGHPYFYLFAKEELLGTQYEYCQPIVAIPANAKAQFKCPNPQCGHAWTSMQARILFTLSVADVILIVLEILGQECQQCGTYANALWYIDEVCRVMKYLAYVIFTRYYPNMLNDPCLEKTGIEDHLSKSFTPKRHDPAQRKGKMSARHNSQHCEACHRGVCFSTITTTQGYYM